MHLASTPLRRSTHHLESSGSLSGYALPEMRVEFVNFSRWSDEMTFCRHAPRRRRAVLRQATSDGRSSDDALSILLTGRECARLDFCSPIASSSVTGTPNVGIATTRRGGRVSRAKPNAAARRTQASGTRTAGRTSNGTANGLGRLRERRRWRKRGGQVVQLASLALLAPRWKVRVGWLWLARRTQETSWRCAVIFLLLLRRFLKLLRQEGSISINSRAKY